MSSFEERTTRVSFFGQFADERTRRSIPSGEFYVELLDNGGAKPFYKEDGSFAFIDLESRPSSYAISVSGHHYRARELGAILPTLDAVPLARDGEDELYVTVTNVIPGPPTDRVEFLPIPFLPIIGAGASVIGEGGFAGKLDKPIEGEDVDFAELDTVAGLASGEVLRIARSDRLLLRAGPYYVFSDPATVLSARFVENTPSGAPVAGVQMSLREVNGVVTTTVTVGGIILHRVQLAGDSVILGPQSAVETRSNTRGEALLDFPAHLSITNLRLQVSHPDYAPILQTVVVTAGGVTRWGPPLTPI